MNTVNRKKINAKKSNVHKPIVNRIQSSTLAAGSASAITSNIIEGVASSRKRRKPNWQNNYHMTSGSVVEETQLLSSQILHPQQPLSSTWIEKGLQ